jgi:hypothetical protein
MNAADVVFVSRPVDYSRSDGTASRGELRVFAPLRRDVDGQPELEFWECRFELVLGSDSFGATVTGTDGLEALMHALGHAGIAVSRRPLPAGLTKIAWYGDESLGLPFPGRAWP